MRDDRRSRYGHGLPPTVWDRLSNADEPCRYVEENPSRLDVHPASLDDCREVIARLPDEIANKVRAVILRRPRERELREAVEGWARRGVVCLVAMPATLRYQWDGHLSGGERRHYAPWCDRWIITDTTTTLQWTLEEARHYYRYHILLHEIGHVVDPKLWRRRGRARESYAEDFALHWARELGAIDP